MKKFVRWTVTVTLSILQTACSGLWTPETLVSHGLSFQRLRAGGRSTLEVGPLAASEHGTVILASVGRGDVTAFVPPEDNRGNALQQLGATHTYTMWPKSGTALYALPLGEGGSPTIRVGTPPSDEVTLAVVAIKGTRISDASWTEAGAARKYTSRPVKTSGPATLVAFWWGDASEGGRKLAIPSLGFSVVDSVTAPGALVQCAVAVRHVKSAGTYDVSWTAFPRQGAQLWLVAIE